jgi:membrane dipeptidase
MSYPLFVDAHQDIAYNFINFQRDFQEDLAAIRQRESGTQHETRNGIATSTLAATLQGGIGLVFATLFVSPHWGGFGRLYHNQQQAHEQAIEQLQYYTRLLAHSQIRGVRTLADLEATAATWDAPPHQRTLGVVFLMEGADPIREPDEVGWWADQGVRIIGPAWSTTRYSGGTVMNGIGGGPLTDDGRTLLRQMAEQDVILDLSHMSEEAFMEAVASYQGTLIASHSNPRAFCDTGRHLTDVMIRQLADRNGVMGLMPYNNFLHTSREWASDKTHTPLTRFADCIDYVCQLLGSAQHVGIGSDYDGGFGAGSIPAEMDSIADLPLIADTLGARGYSASDIEAICSGNFLRVLRQSLA